MKTHMNEMKDFKHVEPLGQRHGGKLLILAFSIIICSESFINWMGV